MCRLLTRADVIVKKGRPECRKRRMVIATRVDDFDNFALSGEGWRIDDQVTQDARMHEIAFIVPVCSVPFKVPANIVGPSCIWFEIMMFGSIQR